MKSVLQKCYDDWGNLKDNALNIAFNLGKKEGLRKGKTDAEKEHLQMCDSCIHKVSKEEIEQIKADAIELFAEDIINTINFEEKWLFNCKSNNADTNIMIGSLKAFVMSRAEELKEQKNEH